MNLRPFEIALVVIFGGLALLAMVLLVTFQGGGGEQGEGPVITGPVEIWGTLPEPPMWALLNELSREQPAFNQVEYRYIAPDQFDNELLNALAERRQPDIIFISHERLIEHRSKIYPISYDFYPFRDYRSLYVDGTEIFALSDGIYAWPIAVDPLMLYWNRDMLATENFLEPPATWESLVSEYAPALTERNDLRQIQRSTVAMGPVDNVSHPVGLLSTLFIQGGSQLVREDAQGFYDVGINEGPESGVFPLANALRFYTRFGDPANPLYSWNRSLPLDRDMFTREELAFYFGFGSEARRIEELNPNLNFDIAEMPQGATASVRRTYGRIYGLALLRESANANAASQVQVLLASDAVSQRIAHSYGMAAPQQALVTAGSNDLYGRVIYRSAPITRGWLNPDMDETEEIFARAIRDVNANRSLPTGAATDITSLLNFQYED